MTTPAYDRDFWEQLWTRTLRERGVAGSVRELVRRMAAGVAPGGTLLLVGHRPTDPASGAPTPAAGQQQVSVRAAVAALDPLKWKVIVAQERPRDAAGSGVDAVIRASRRS